MGTIKFLEQADSRGIYVDLFWNPSKRNAFDFENLDEFLPAGSLLPSAFGKNKSINTIGKDKVGFDKRMPEWQMYRYQPLMSLRYYEQFDQTNPKKSILRTIVESKHEYGRYPSGKLEYHNMIHLGHLCFPESNPAIQPKDESTPDNLRKGKPNPPEDKSTSKGKSNPEVKSESTDNKEESKSTEQKVNYSTQASDPNPFNALADATPQGERWSDMVDDDGTVHPLLSSLAMSDPCANIILQEDTGGVETPIESQSQDGGAPVASDLP